MIPRCYVSSRNMFSQRLYGPRYQKHQISNFQLYCTGDVRHVLDGGHFCIGYIGLVVLHFTETYLCLMYCDYVTRKHHQPHVVFDVYEEYTTKFMTHQRRATGTVGADVTFTDEMKLSQKKYELLSNSQNKQS